MINCHYIRYKHIFSWIQEMFKILVYMWDKIFKNGTSKICGRQPFKILKWYGLLLVDYTPEDCLPQILLGAFMNTLSHISITIVHLKLKVLAQKGCGLNISSIIWCKFTTSTCTSTFTFYCILWIWQPHYFGSTIQPSAFHDSSLFPHFISCKKKNLETEA